MADALLAQLGTPATAPQCPLCYRHDGTHVQGCRIPAYLAGQPTADIRSLRARIAALAAALEAVVAYTCDGAAPALQAQHARTVALVALGRR